MPLNVVISKSNLDRMRRKSERIEMSPDHYTHRVTWSRENASMQDYLEFPSLSWLAPIHEEALAGIRQVVAEAVADRS
jgi:hypothetical protein